MKKEIEYNEETLRKQKTATKVMAIIIIIFILVIAIESIVIKKLEDDKSVCKNDFQLIVSQRIQSFNDQFTAYEGYKKGAELRGLTSTVKIGNATDSTHQVDLYIKSGLKNAAGEEIKTLSDLTSSETYEVTFFYAEKDTGNNDLSGIRIAGSGDAKNKTEKGFIYAILISK